MTVCVAGWIAVLTIGLAARCDERSPATSAERSEFRATARHDEVLAFIDQLDKRYQHVRRLDFGTTAEGRPLLHDVAGETLNSKRK